MFASDKQCSNTSISLNRESRPCFAGIGCIKPMLNKITRTIDALGAKAERARRVFMDIPLPRTSPLHSLARDYSIFMNGTNGPYMYIIAMAAWITLLRLQGLVPG